MIFKKSAPKVCDQSSVLVHSANQSSRWCSRRSLLPRYAKAISRRRYEDAMPFQFAIYYLFDKSLKVESTSILLGNIDQLSQVTSKRDLDGDDNWLEIKWPTRKEPEKTVPAKVLLFGGPSVFYFCYTLLSVSLRYCVAFFW